MESYPSNRITTMKKTNNLIALLIMLTGSALSGIYGPWYAPSIFIFLASALLALPSKKGLSIGGVSLGLVYFLISLYQFTQDETNLLSKIGVVMGGLSPIALIVLSTVIGMITGMLSGWVGSSLAESLKKS